MKQEEACVGQMLYWLSMWISLIFYHPTNLLCKYQNLVLLNSKESLMSCSNASHYRTIFVAVFRTSHEKQKYDYAHFVFEFNLPEV
mmetsp:Transcript_37150/g.42390  ORF Transcript_37150/g.42390 Transcript_37150/m.42390 type:complete len:86 (-) Transcript_37150:99-356(-)